MEIKVRNDLFMKSREKKDAEEVFQVIDKNRNYLRTWLPWVDGTENIHTVEEVIESWQEEFAKGTDQVFGIMKDGQYIGNIGIHNLKNPNSSGMIGYWLAESEQGKGIITDCVRALTDYGFHSLALNRIYIYAAEVNLKSRAVPERLGYMLEGVLQDGEYLYGKYFNLAVYGMVKRNWH